MLHVELFGFEIQGGFGIDW